MARYRTPKGTLSDDVVRERIWKRIDTDSSPVGCWLWTGCLYRDGYARIVRDGRSLKAHRRMYELFVGPIPSGMMVLHSCDVRRCVNPKHLRIGTAQDNATDALVRDRVFRISQSQTHCKRGHEFTPENTYVAHTDGYLIRHCRACKWIRAEMKKEAVS